MRWQRNSGGGQRLFSTPLSVLTSSSLSPPLSLSKTGPGTRPGPGGAPLISTGVAGIDSDDHLEERIAAAMWEPEYYPVRAV